LTRPVWLPIGKPPDQLIDLESAVQRVVAAKYGAGFIAEWTTATLRGEYEAQIYGGVRSLAWEDARAWTLRQLQRGELQLLQVTKADPPVIRAASADFWRSSDHDDIPPQRQILDRGTDPSGEWIYALDESILTSLLASDVRGKARPTLLEPTGPVSLDEAIKRVLGVKGQPPRDIRWKSFCHEVRNLCGVNDVARGYGDRTIKAKVGKIGKK
jgi:hypothetical protein